MAQLLKSRHTTKKNIIENIKLYYKRFTEKVFSKGYSSMYCKCTRHVHVCNVSKWLQLISAHHNHQVQYVKLTPKVVSRKLCQPDSSLCDSVSSLSII